MQISEPSGALAISTTTTETPADKAPKTFPLGLDESTWTFRFMCDGKRFSLIKRDPSRMGVWYLACHIHKKRIVRSLDTHIAEVAVSRACKNHIRPARSNRMDKAMESALRSPVSTIGEIEDCYRAMSIGKIADGTLKTNFNALRMLVRRGLDRDDMTIEQVRATSAAVLTGALVSQFEDWMSRDAVRAGRDLESNKRTVDSVVSAARSFFKVIALPRYAEHGVTLPPALLEINRTDLTGFMKRQIERPAKLTRIAPPDDVLARTFEASAGLRVSDPAGYIAFLLAASTMRCGEIGAMRWDWISERNGKPCVVIPAPSAKSRASRKLTLDARVAAALQLFRVEHRSKGIDLDEESFVIPSTPGRPRARRRGQAVFGRVSTWMRGLGWTSNHTMHEMRALVLTWVRDNFGLDAAQCVAGHSSPRTTIDSYVGQMKSDGIVLALPFEC